MTTKKRTSRSKKPLSPAARQRRAYEVAFEKKRPKFEALTSSELLPVNLDLRLAAKITIAAAPKIAEHRALLATLPGGYAQLSDELEDLGRAAMVVARKTEGLKPKTVVSSLAQEGTPIRRKLVGAVRHLIDFELIDEDVLEGLGLKGGHQGLADDLSLLFEVAEDNWTVISKNTALDWDTVENAVGIRTDLQDALSVKTAFGPGTLVLRGQAYTALKRTYDKLRMALQFLEVDNTDAIAPSWFSHRANKAEAGGATEVAGDEGTEDGPAVSALPEVIEVIEDPEDDTVEVSPSRVANVDSGKATPEVSPPVASETSEVTDSPDSDGTDAPMVEAGC